MSGGKKESYVNYLKSNSGSISSGSPIKEFMRRTPAILLWLANGMQALPNVT
jgi:hypothetical protein